MPQLSAAEGHADCCNFILGNYFFAFNILSTMCQCLVAEADLRPIPKAWLCQLQVG